MAAKKTVTDPSTPAPKKAKAASKPKPKSFAQQRAEQKRKEKAMFERLELYREWMLDRVAELTMTPRNAWSLDEKHSLVFFHPVVDLPVFKRCIRVFTGIEPEDGGPRGELVFELSKDGKHIAWLHIPHELMAKRIASGSGNVQP